MKYPKFTTDKDAWTWIAEELSQLPGISRIPDDKCAGLCVVLRGMHERDMITERRRANMVARLFVRFRPQSRLGEWTDGPFFWNKGVRPPRVMAAQLMALLPVPRVRGR